MWFWQRQSGRFISHPTEVASALCLLKNWTSPWMPDQSRWCLSFLEWNWGPQQLSPCHVPIPDSHKNIDTATKIRTDAQVLCWNGMPTSGTSPMGTWPFEGRTGGFSTVTSWCTIGHKNPVHEFRGAHPCWNLGFSLLWDGWHASCLPERMDIFCLS